MSLNISKIIDELKPVFKYLNTDEIYKRFDEPWRFYHNSEHIIELYSKLEKSSYMNDKKKYYKLLCLIVFHDIIYYPWETDNELESAEYFKRISDQIEDDYKDIIGWVYDGIISTKEHNKNGDYLLDDFLMWDMDILNSEPYKLLKYEKQIQEEYSFVGTSVYKRHRLDFLNKNVNEYPNLKILIEDLENEYRPKVGFYAGSFNPFHVGHLNIVQQAQKVYDKVVILIGQNANKPILTDEEIEKRTKHIFSICPGIDIQYFKGFIPNFLIERSIEEDVFLIRGIRNTMDWMEESNYLQYCLKMMPSLQVQYYTCPKDIEHVSSSGIRAMEMEQEGSAVEYIPKLLLDGNG